jgi:hypothetical protein
MKEGSPCRAPGLYPYPMVLAVSGQLFMGVVIAFAVLLLFVLLRSENRADAREEAEQGRGPLRPPRRR